MAAVQPAKRGGGKKEGIKKKKVRSQVFIDMTPMVDIAFLLLIFFMVTTVFRAPQTMEINIPPSEKKVEIAESNVMVVRMLDDGRIYWSIGKGTPEEVKFEDIQKLLIEKNEDNEKLVTLVKIQRTSPYEQMVNIMDEMQLGSIDRFSITVMEAEEVKEVFGS